LAVFCLIMAGGVLGFLRYNIHPARTFLGDSGSMVLGFILSVLSIVQSAKTATFLVLVVPALLLALPMLDTVFAFTRRGVKGQNPFTADRGHLHHRLLDLNFTQRQTLGIFFSLSTGLGLLALWLAQTRQVHVLTLAILLLVLTLIVVKAMQIYNFHGVIQGMNSRMRAFAKKAVEKERPGEERAMKNFAVLSGLCFLNFILALWGPQKSLIIAVAAIGIIAVGLVEVFLGRRDAEARFEILHVALFLSLVINQVAILALWHRDYLVAPHFAVSAFLVLILLALFIYRTGTFAVFLQDPMEILALYMGIILCGTAKHYLGAPTMLPFAVALANALVLYILLKVYLSGYRMRSWTYSIGFAACVALLVSVPWWG
jgi:UDP-N-acetylmuramyl pentapeptide phosphotransferase/UDP-N-acetylglucosamine-1-phosphate transferase